MQTCILLLYSDINFHCSAQIVSTAANLQRHLIENSNQLLLVSVYIINFSPLESDSYRSHHSVVLDYVTDSCYLMQLLVPCCSCSGASDYAAVTCCHCGFCCGSVDRQTDSVHACHADPICCDCEIYGGVGHAIANGIAKLICTQQTTQE